jgi:pSer/pThr/pTyr-binding forkhead associated (FHA) protein
VAAERVRPSFLATISVTTVMATYKKNPDELATAPIEAFSDLQLRVALGDQVRLLPLATRGPFVIGRSSTADIRIDHGSISRRHAELRVKPGLAVVDLSSQNGTRVRGALVAPSQPVDVVPGESFQVGLATLTVEARSPPSKVDASPLRSELRASEREKIRAALEQCGGNQTKAARLLGISRRSLVSRLSKHDLPRPRKA